jgi:hypothetical protein
VLDGSKIYRDQSNREKNLECVEYGQRCPKKQVRSKLYISRIF